MTDDYTHIFEVLDLEMGWPKVLRISELPEEQKSLYMVLRRFEALLEKEAASPAYPFAEGVSLHFTTKPENVGILTAYGTRHADLLTMSIERDSALRDVCNVYVTLKGPKAPLSDAERTQWQRFSDAIMNAGEVSTAIESDHTGRVIRERTVKSIPGQPYEETDIHYPDFGKTPKHEE